MHQCLRTALPAILALASTCGALAQQPAPTGRPGGAGAASATPATPPNPAIFKQVLATVNGEPITRGELINFLSRVPLPPGEEKDTYRAGIDYLANFKLLSQFLTKQRVPVSDKELDAKIAEIERKMKAEGGGTLKIVLAEAGSTMDDLKSQLTWQIGWEKYSNAAATDAALQKFSNDNKDLFTRVQVRASHILLLVPPDAPASVKETARQKLLDIKAQIESGKISFADAANKFSEDEANKTTPNGGDLGYFSRKGQFIEKFAAAAFGMQKGQISNPVETEYGLHLIQVTDRKPGVPFDFAQNRTAVLNQYMTDLQERIINNERKTAKIDIKPMPADLFPPAQGPPAGAPAAGAATNKPAAPR